MHNKLPALLLFILGICLTTAQLDAQRFGCRRARAFRPINNCRPQVVQHCRPTNCYQQSPRVVQYAPAVQYHRYAPAVQYAPQNSCCPVQQNPCQPNCYPSSRNCYPAQIRQTYRGCVANCKKQYLLPGYCRSKCIQHCSYPGSQHISNCYPVLGGHIHCLNGGVNGEVCYFCQLFGPCHQIIE